MVNEKRLIDANALMEQVNNLCSDGNENWIGTDNNSYIDHADVVDIISDAPTVDAVEVWHGHWEYGKWEYGHWVKGNERCRCSVCRRDFAVDNSNIWHGCPQCLAKMDGGNEDG